MKKLYLITGASGHLGINLIQALLQKDCDIRVFCLPKDKKHFPSSIQVITGDIRDKEALRPFFDITNYEEVTLIHAAAKISILSKEDPTVWDINVNGTKNVMELALNTHLTRVLYISSIHAIKEQPLPTIIQETKTFSKENVVGQYAKSKAEAARIVLEYADKGLPVSILHPTGIIGPGDLNHTNNSVSTIIAIRKGLLPFPIQGGYDFVDVRDVVDGILKCEEKGRVGECYILSGTYLTIQRMFELVKGKKEPFVFPSKIAKVFAPLMEKGSLRLGIKQPLITPYSLYTLQTNAHFSHEKATKEFNYQTRDIKETIKDSK